MRLTAEQLESIRAAVAETAGDEVRAFVFGSRLDDARRGGDLDLLLRAPHRIGLLSRARLKQRLEARLSMPVDVLSMQDGREPTPFEAIALARAVQI